MVLSIICNLLYITDEHIMTLAVCADGTEHLQPETTANPALHRFFAFMAARAVDPEARLPAQDLQVQHTLSCPFGHTDKAQAALNQLPEHFSVKQQVSSHVRHINDAQIVFRQLMLQSATRAVLC